MFTLIMIGAGVGIALSFSCIFWAIVSQPQTLAMSRPGAQIALPARMAAVTLTGK